MVAVSRYYQDYTRCLSFTIAACNNRSAFGLGLVFFQNRNCCPRFVTATITNSIVTRLYFCYFCTSYFLSAIFFQESFYALITNKAESITFP